MSEEEQSADTVNASGSDCSDSDSGGGSSAPEAPTLNIHDRRRRSTAGSNFVLREGKALEDDKAFWEHSAFKEAASDSEVNFSNDDVDDDDDSSDSDIDKSEQADSGDDDGYVEEDETKLRRTRRKVPLLAKALLKRPAPKAPKKQQRRVFKTQPAPDRGIRASTRQLRAEVEARAAQREEEVVTKVRRVRSVQTITQQERLDEAALTEAKNLQDLQARRNWEDETKQQARRSFKRKRYQGPRVRFVSRLGEGPALLGGRPGTVNSVEFIACELPKVLSTCPPVLLPEKPLCVVTGRPARYREPVTGQPFATAAAFLQLRHKDIGF